METIHFKTVDPVSQELLRDASRKGDRTDDTGNRHILHVAPPVFFFAGAGLPPPSSSM